MAYYTKQERERMRDEWNAKLQSWQTSQLSAAAWCRKENIPYCRFLYWKEKLLEHHEDRIQPEPFIELSDCDEGSGIEIIMSEAVIRLSKNFDPSTLRKCIQTLRSVKC